MPRSRPFAMLVLLIVAVAAPVRATTYQVGSGQTYTDYSQLPDLQPGDIVEIHSGTYRTAYKWGVLHSYDGTAQDPIIIRGVGSTRPIIDGMTIGSTYPQALNDSHVLAQTDLSGSSWHPSAMFVLEGDNIIVEHLEFVNSSNGSLKPDGTRNPNNASGFISFKNDGCIIRDCVVHDNDNGIRSTRVNHFTVENCDVYHNALTDDGNTHNLYVEGGYIAVHGCNIYNPHGGLNLKVRGHYAEILYNYIHDGVTGDLEFVDLPINETGTYGAPASTAVPNSNALVMGNIIESKSAYSPSNNYVKMINFGSEGWEVRDGTLYLVNNTIISGSGLSQAVMCLNGNNISDLHVMAINNIFFNIKYIAHLDAPPPDFQGHNNWVQSFAVVPSGFTGTIVDGNPGIVDVPNHDFRLGAWSTARDHGLANATIVDGTGSTVSAVPDSYYVDYTTLGTRDVDATIDIGAYEADTSVSPSSPTAKRFDFGTDASPVMTGYTKVALDDVNNNSALLYDVDSGFGWFSNGVSNAGLSIADQPTGGGTDLTRDFHWASDATFEVDVPNGNYTVGLTLGDANYTRPPADIYLNDRKVDTFGTTAGQWQTHAYDLTVTTCRINLHIHAPTDYFCIDGLQIVPQGQSLNPEADSYPEPPSVPMFYDFGTSGSPVMINYTQITESTAYSSSNGYGWVDPGQTVNGSFDRSASGWNNLARDCVYFEDATFLVDLPNGDYNVTITAADTEDTRDLMAIVLEGTQVGLITATYNQITQATYRTTVSDGQLTLRMHDTGGDPYCVLNGLSIASVSGDAGRKHPVHPHRGRDRRRR